MARPETPALTVDIIIEMHDRSARPIVVIERKNPPYGWSLPGGFVDSGETVTRAAIREALEETCLDVTLDSLLGCYSEPTRDPRGHTASLVYIAHAIGEPRADDDAASVQLLDACAQVKTSDKVLVFDHEKIIADYCRYRQSGLLPTLQG